MKNIFITGICGLLGSNLAKHFKLQGYNVGGIDSLVGGYEDNLPKSIQFMKEDILIFSDKNNYFEPPGLYDIKNQTSNVDVVIHCAALAHEGVSVFSPHLITQNIYSGTIAAYVRAVQMKAKLFINFSSMARYGNGKPPFSEMSACNPVDPYGLAKLQAEQQLRLLSDIHGVKVITVVPHNVIGPGQVYTDRYRNVASIMMNSLYIKQPITIYGDGKQKRSFSHVDDCVFAVSKLVQNPDLLGSNEIINIGPDKNEITILELVTLIQEVTGIKGEVLHLSDRPREVKYAWCSSDKAKQLLDYKPSKDIKQTLQDINQFILLRGPAMFDTRMRIEIERKDLPDTWKRGFHHNYHTSI